MASVVIVGAQWGDEGKGKIVDLLAEKARMVVRYQGGNNAGHTLVVGGEKTVVHLIPSGVLQPGVINVVAQGVVVDPEVLCRELDSLASKGFRPSPEHLVLSRRAAVIMPYHRSIDQARESRLAGRKIGTTGRGIGPAYEDVASRRAVRLGDLTDRDRLGERLDRVLDERNATLTWLGAEPVARGPLMDELLALGDRIAPWLGEAEDRVRDALAAGDEILFEGAQGTLLDVLHGTYPFVTSSSTLAGAVTTGIGVPPGSLGHVLGIAKAYATRVGSGPFPTELEGEVAERLRKVGLEFGSTTGRPRRCGWLDLAALRSAHRLNGFTSLALMKLDVLSGLATLKLGVGYTLPRDPVGSAAATTVAAAVRSVPTPADPPILDRLPSDDADVAALEPIYEELPGWSEDITGCRTFESLPVAARAYVSFIESRTGIPVSLIGVGPGREAIIARSDPWEE